MVKRAEETARDIRWADDTISWSHFSDWMLDNDAMLLPDCIRELLWQCWRDAIESMEVKDG